MRESSLLKTMTKQKLLQLTALVILSIQTTQAGFVFNDIRPRSYAPSRTLDIHVGNLISPQSTIAHDFYYVNYCPSRSIHHYSDTKEAK